MTAPVKTESCGRIVIYQHPGSADGTYPATQSPAIVQSVNPDGTICAWVFGPWGIHLNKSMKQGDGPCEWNWPVVK